MKTKSNMTVKKPKELDWEKELVKIFIKVLNWYQWKDGSWDTDEGRIGDEQFTKIKQFIKQTLTQQRTELLEEITDILDNIDTGMYVDDEWVSNSEELTELRKSLKNL